MSMKKHLKPCSFEYECNNNKLGKHIPDAISLQSLHTFNMLSTQPKYEFKELGEGIVNFWSWWR